MRYILLAILLGAILLKYWGLPGSLEEEGFEGRRAGLYETGMTDPYLTHPRLYQNVNGQQAIYSELVRLFEWFSSGKQEEVKGSYELYKPETLDVDVTDELNQISDAVLERVRENSQFHLVRNQYQTYDNVKQFQSPNGPAQYKYEIFVQDPVNDFELKLEVDAIKYVPEQAYRDRLAKRKQAIEGACASTVWPVFPTYPGGYPQPRQEIPLPTQVIPTGLQVIGLGGINVEPILPIERLHINSIRIANSTLVLNPECAEGFSTMGGYSDGTLDSQFCSGDGGGPCQATSKERNPWIPVPGEDRFKHYSQACSPTVFNWDSHGVLYPPPEPCAGLRDPKIQQPFTAEYNPSVATIPRGQGDNAWLFSLARGDRTGWTS